MTARYTVARDTSRGWKDSTARYIIVDTTTNSTADEGFTNRKLAAQWAAHLNREDRTMNTRTDVNYRVILNVPSEIELPADLYFGDRDYTDGWVFATQAEADAFAAHAITSHPGVVVGASVITTEGPVDAPQVLCRLCGTPVTKEGRRWVHAVDSPHGSTSDYCLQERRRDDHLHHSHRADSRASYLENGRPEDCAGHGSPMSDLADDMIA